MILDLFLAARMRPHTDLRLRLAAASIDEADLKAALEAADQAGIMRRRVLPATLIKYLGEPDKIGSNRLVYNMTLWPQHTFEFGIHVGGWILYHGFVLREELPTSPHPLDVSSASIRRAFEVGMHTREQVAEALGPPSTRQGWNGMEDFFYSSGPDTYVVLEFDFGLLTGISARNPILL